MKLLKLITVFLIVSIFVSCSTIVNTDRQQVKITSSPDKAKVTITNTGGFEVFNGETPVDTKLKRKFDYVVEISLPGYKSEKIQITKGFEPMFLGNIICGGIIGMIIDFASGAVNRLEPDEIYVEMVTASYGNSEELFAVFKTLDDNGELRTLAIPMTKL